jgi:hypothetical protein
MSQPYQLYFKLTRTPNMGLIMSGRSESLLVEHTVVDEDPVNVIERAMLTLENTRDELLAQREPTVRYEANPHLTTDEEDQLIEKYTVNRSHAPCADVGLKIPHDPHPHGTKPGEQIMSCPGYTNPTPKVMPHKLIRDNPQG